MDEVHYDGFGGSLDLDRPSFHHLHYTIDVLQVRHCQIEGRLGDLDAPERTAGLCPGGHVDLSERIVGRTEACHGLLEM